MNAASTHALALNRLLLVLGLMLGLIAPATEAQVTGLTGRAAKRSTTPPAFPITETWTFDESTTGADIVWASPTTVDPTAPLYKLLFTLDTIEVSASFLGIPLGAFDVTDQVPPELLQSVGFASGPAPVQLLNQPVIAPPPPDPIAVGATLSMSIDAMGQAHLLANNIVLGTTMVDVGAPFGVVTVNITGFRIAGTLSVTALPWRFLPL